MIAFYWIGGVLSLGLLGYLLFALLRPESLS
jgi:K+-transporting ATPase KdpF subunit